MHMVVPQDVVTHVNTDSVSQIFNQKLGSSKFPIGTLQKNFGTDRVPIGAFSVRTVTHVPEDQECSEDGADMQTLLPMDAIDHLEDPADDCGAMLEEATTVLPESDYVATEVPDLEFPWDDDDVQPADCDAPALKKRRT
jgi:hypothetical protein